MTRSLRLIAVLTAVITGSLLCGVTGPAMASAAPSGSPLQLSLVSVPLSSLPAALRARLAHDKAVPDSIPSNAFEIKNGEDNGKFCLDANDAGSTAGKNGDKVQLWTCSGHANQYWIPGDETSSPTGFYTLENAEWPSECLNARTNGGLHDGSKVQLWSCGGEANDLWDVEGWLTCFDYHATYCTLPLQADGVKYVLDATLQDIGNGDQMQIWTPDDGLNQGWEPS
jgi:hypothetical protein